MSDTAIIEIATMTMIVALKLAAPILLPSLVVGFVISLFQAMTQIQEVTLSFVPKLVSVGISLVLCGGWMMQTISSYTQAMFDLIPTVL